MPSRRGSEWVSATAHAGAVRAARKAGQLAMVGAPAATTVKDGRFTLRLALPRQAISLICLEW